MTPAIDAVNDQAAKATHPQLCVISKVSFFYCKPRDCLGYYIATINTYHCLLCQLFVYFHLPAYYCCNTRSGEVIPLRIPSRKRYPGFSLTWLLAFTKSLAWLVCRLKWHVVEFLQNSTKCHFNRPGNTRIRSVKGILALFSYILIFGLFQFTGVSTTHRINLSM